MKDIEQYLQVLIGVSLSECPYKVGDFIRDNLGWVKIEGLNINYSTDIALSFYGKRHTYTFKPHARVSTISIPLNGILEHRPAAQVQPPSSQ